MIEKDVPVPPAGRPKPPIPDIPRQAQGMPSKRPERCPECNHWLREGVVIEKRVPVPPIDRKRLYPWEDMVRGDSFYTESSCGLRLVGVANERYWPKRFTGRYEGHGVRIWRVK